jgi:hypothetical protein
VERHGEYLGKEKRGLIDRGPVMEELRTVARYEAFVREGVKETYRAEWHPGDHAPFLGSERFVRKMVKEKTPPPASRRVSLGNLLQKVASGARLNPQSLKRKGRTTDMVEARDRFICQAVFEEEYLASELASFLGCHPSNVSRALQKRLAS